MVYDMTIKEVSEKYDISTGIPSGITSVLD